MTGLLLPGDLLAGPYASSPAKVRLAQAKKVAAAVETNNLVINPIVSLATIDSPASSPDTSGMTNFLPAATGYVASFTGTTTAGSTTISGVNSTAGLIAGQPLCQNMSTALYPTHIPLGATLQTIVDSATIIMSKPATASGSVTIKAAHAGLELIGGVAGGYGGNFCAVAHHVAKASPQTGRPAYAVEFMTDAATIATASFHIVFSLYQNGVTPNAFKVAIDNVYQMATPQSFGGTGSTYLSLRFSTPGPHKVRLELPSGYLLQKIHLINGARLWKQKRANALRVCFFGDSYFGGGDTNNNWGHANIACRTASMMGWLHDLNAQSGTGYIANGSTNYAWQEPERQADIAIRAYDAVVCFGSVNDGGQNAATIQAAALTTWSGLRSYAPNVPFFIFGCPTTVTTTASTAAMIESGLSAAFTAWGDRRAWYIPVTGDPNGAWLDTGNVGAYIGADNTHLTDTGCQYVAERMTQALRGILSQQP